MWDYIEKHISPIPEFIKIILKRNGFDNPITLKDISEAHIIDIENYVKDLINTKTETDLINYLNEYLIHYDVNPKHFKIANGHKLLIFSIKNIINEKGVDYIIASALENKKALLKTRKRKLNATEITGEIPVTKPERKYTQSRLTQVQLKELTKDLESFYENRLLSSVNGWIKNSSHTENPNFITEVKIILNDRKQVEGLVQCSYCERQIKVQCTNNRWIVTNYSRHFNKHTKPTKIETPKIQSEELFLHFNNFHKKQPVEEDVKVFDKHKLLQPKMENMVSMSSDVYLEDEIEQESNDESSCVESNIPYDAAVSTRILDVSTGKPASELSISFYKLQDGEWILLVEGQSNMDGRLDLMCRSEMTEACYKIQFHISEYFERNNIQSLFPFLEIPFNITNVNENYHIPLFLTPFGFSSYRIF